MLDPLDDFDQTFRHEGFKSVVDRAVEHFEASPAHLLPPDRFDGAGVYALYYVGGLPLYAPLAELTSQTFSHPIYVGKAVSAGSRKGVSVATGGASLNKRLSEHAGSIRIATNLDLDDFRCRYMVLEGETASLTGAVESALIQRYRPLWNSTVDGFGNHTPGAGRFDQSPSEWDTLHPGRFWVSRLTGVAPDLDGIRARVTSHLAELI